MSDEKEDQICLEKPVIGVSRCLLGDRVRYDGSGERTPWIVEILSTHCDLLPLCPEVEAGLGVPRPPVRLVRNDDTLAVVGREDSSLDVTEALSRVWKDRRNDVVGMDGLILKSRSPSCGVADTPVFSETGTESTRGPGVFTRQCVEAFPLLPLIDELSLENEVGRVSFLIQVFRYRCRRLQALPH
ncbi:MAG: DUF523 domain-containing protein [Gammaproteobacteria bacterium]|nr:DUF523 domain-containing protein [Gammaproteobacteria bacterium]